MCGHPVKIHAPLYGYPILLTAYCVLLRGRLSSFTTAIDGWQLHLNLKVTGPTELILSPWRYVIDLGGEFSFTTAETPAEHYKINTLDYLFPVAAAGFSGLEGQYMRGRRSATDRLATFNTTISLCAILRNAGLTFALLGSCPASVS